MKVAAAVACAAAALCTAAAWATPNVPLDDPLYEALLRLRAEGKIPPFTGGAEPLTRSEMERLFLLAHDSADAAEVRAPSGFWLSPADRVALRLNLVDEHQRPYSTAARPRQIAGVVDLSCEHTEGRPCGPGAGAGIELDSAAGYGRWVSAYTRLRLEGGNHDYSRGFEVDRAYLNAELGPVALEVGRDVQKLAPWGRTSLMLGDNAAPLDHVRISTSHPLELGTEAVRISLRYFVARLRDPQRFHGTLLTGGRAQLDLFEGLELGGTRLLELGGDGAPSFTFGQFVLEHLFRQGSSQGAGISNNRLSFDAAYTAKSLRGTRFYVGLAFEDTRSQFLNTLEFDTDYLVGIDVPDFDGTKRLGLLVELHRTGRSSQEHSTFTTGMTNLGRTLGSPLGPDTWSVFAQGKVDTSIARFAPWVEMARLSSDVYTATETGPVERIRSGPAEKRLRGGMHASVALREKVLLRVDGFAERIFTAGFDPAATAVNAGVMASLWFGPGPVLH